MAMESVTQLAKKAIELEPVERIQLVEAILRSLDKSEARYEAYKRGEIGSTDWEEIKAKYKR